MKENEVQAIRDVQHFGEQGGVVPVIDVASTSTFIHADDMDRVFKGELEGCYLYSRQSNPSVEAFSEKIAAMEHTEEAFGVASGMAAISCTIGQIFLEGGHLIAANSIYGGTYALFANIFTRHNIDVSFVDMQNLAEVEKAFRADTKAVYLESMSNPLLRVADLKGVASLCHRRGARLVVDNTFTPLLISPKKFGADLIIHSCTKFISGASDLIGGVVAGEKEFIRSLKDVNSGMAMLFGPVMDARVAHELYLRLDHLHLRMRGHSEAALKLALEMEKRGLRVIYPGLKSHPDHLGFSSLLNSGYGFGGMMTIDLGTHQRANHLAELLQEKKFGLFAVSLGFSRTLISCPAASTSSEIPEMERKKIGLSEGLLRLSLGFSGDQEEMTRRFFECYDLLQKEEKK